MIKLQSLHDHDLNWEEKRKKKKPGSEIHSGRVSDFLARSPNGDAPVLIPGAHELLSGAPRGDLARSGASASPCGDSGESLAGTCVGGVSKERSGRMALLSDLARPRVSVGERSEEDIENGVLRV